MASTNDSANSVSANPPERGLRMEAITGEKPPTRTTCQQRRKQILTALFEDYVDNLDHLADEYGRFFDHLRAVGIRAFIAEHTHDEDFTFKEGRLPGLPPDFERDYTKEPASATAILPSAPGAT